MPRCEVCGNEYENCFEVVQGETRHVFDCFECAVYLLAPCCAHCNVRILGHGIDASGVTYCCTHCAEAAGAEPRPALAHSGRH